MDAFALLRNPKRCKTMFFAFLVSGFLWTSPATAGDMMSTICNNQVVSVGARQGEVLAKCGNPLSKSHETVDTGTSQVLKKKQSGKKKTDKDKAEVAKKKTDKEKISCGVEYEEGEDPGGGVRFHRISGSVPAPWGFLSSPLPGLPADGMLPDGGYACHICCSDYPWRRRGL